jgi:hypothetical protein
MVPPGGRHNGGFYEDGTEKTQDQRNRGALGRGGRAGGMAGRAAAATPATTVARSSRQGLEAGDGKGRLLRTGGGGLVVGLSRAVERGPCHSRGTGTNANTISGRGIS